MAAPKKQDPWVRYLPFIATTLVIIEIVLLFTFPSYSEARSVVSQGGKNHEYWSITNRDYPMIVVILIWVVPIFALVAGCVCIARKNWVGLLPITFVCSCPVLGVWIMFVSGMQEFDSGLVVDSKGTEYHALVESFMQGQTLTIARLNSVRGSTKNYEVLVSSPFDSPKYYLRLVRPATAKDGTMIHLVDDHLVISCLGDNRAFGAYDLATETAYNCPFPIHPELVDIKTLSPFVMLKPEDELNESDVKDVLNDFVGDSLQNGPDLPLKAVEAELTNPNPRVREIAAKIAEGLRKEQERLRQVRSQG